MRFQQRQQRRQQQVVGSTRQRARIIAGGTRVRSSTRTRARSLTQQSHAHTQRRRRRRRRLTLPQHSDFNTPLEAAVLAAASGGLGDVAVLVAVAGVLHVLLDAASEETLCEEEGAAD